MECFKPDLVRPGLRVPLTADAALFAEAARLGREVIWLHSFGERLAEGRPAGPPRLPTALRPKVVRPSLPRPRLPRRQRLRHRDAAAEGRQRPHRSGGVGGLGLSGVGKQVLRQWFSYRRKPSPLGDIQPDHWLPDYTEELLNVLNVLGLLIDLEPRQADLLARIFDGPLVAAGKLAA